MMIPVHLEDEEVQYLAELLSDDIRARQLMIETFPGETVANDSIKLMGQSRSLLVKLVEHIADDTERIQSRPDLN